jgi:hypothetical protein
MKRSIAPLVATGLALAGLAIAPLVQAQPTKPPGAAPGKTAPASTGRLQTKSFQPIGKNKIQVDLTVVDAGELQRTLHDYFKQRLQARGNPIGSSGTLAVKLEVQYAQPLPNTGGANNPPPPPPGVGQGTAVGQNNPIPDRKAPAFQQGAPSPGLTTPLHLAVTIYREQGGTVVWTGEATCYTPFASAQATGRTMIDQLVDSIDKTRSGEADCPI